MRIIILLNPSSELKKWSLHGVTTFPCSDAYEIPVCFIMWYANQATPWKTSANTYTCFPTDAVAFGSAHFGAGTGTIYLDGVGCTGSESNLTDCSRSSTVSCFRGHSEDAGVRCQGSCIVSTFQDFSK